MPFFFFFFNPDKAVPHNIRACSFSWRIASVLAEAPEWHEVISGLCLSQDTCGDSSGEHRYLADKNDGVKDLQQEVSGWALPSWKT